ncbi:MAG: hypothetical protein WD534_07935 [Phycisphaeraceae bacterium]
MSQATIHTNGAPVSDGSALERKLRSLWRRQRWHAHGRGLAAVTLTLAALIVGGLLIDWLIFLPPVPRVLLLLGMIAAVGAVAYRQWWVLLRPYDPRRAALQVERHHRQLGSALIAYVQLGPQPDGSQALAAAARQQAVQLAERLSFVELVSFRDLRSLVLGALVAVAVVAGVGVQWPVALATFGERLVNPLSERAYPTRTQVALLEQDRHVPRGAPVTLGAAVAGVVPVEGALELRYLDDEGEATGDWERLPLTVDDEGRLHHRLTSADRSFAYRFRAGDGRSEQAQVTVVAPPRVRRVAVTLNHPEYTGLDEQVSESLNIRAPEGSDAELRLELDRPVTKAELLELGGDGEPTDEPLALDLADGGRTATLALPVRTMNYRLRWTRATNTTGSVETFVFDDPVRHQMQAVPDAAPQVQLLQPVSRNQVGTMSKTVPLVFRASDDHKLTEAWVVYRREGSDEVHQVHIDELEQKTVERNFNWSLGETVEDLAVGDRIQYTIEVQDNRVHDDGRQRSRAEPWRSIEILSVEAFLQHMAERQVESFEQLQRVREETNDWRDDVRRLQREAP